MARSAIVISVLVGAVGCSDGSSATAEASDASADAVPVDAKPPPPVCSAVLVDLPAGSSASAARAIDAAGNVAGSFITVGNERHAFRWHMVTGFVDLGTLPGDIGSIANGISGERTVGSSEEFSSTGSPQPKAFLSDVSGMHVLPMAHAYGVNASGVVVGDVVLPSGFTQAVKYEAGVITELGTLGGAFAITDSGVIAGYDTVASTVGSAVTWNAGVVTRIGPGKATAISQDGDSVICERQLYRHGSPVGLTVPYDIPSCAVSSVGVDGVNDARWAIGSAFCQNTVESPGQNRPVIYPDGTGRNLNSLLTDPAPVFTHAIAINNSGQIAANFGLSAAGLVTCVTPP